MEVRPGYKLTEAGMIPVEWEALPARAIGTVRGGNGFPLVAQGETSGEYPFFKVSDMNNEGNETFMTTANHYVSEQTRKRLGATAFPAGGIVFAKVGAAVFLERKKILGQRSCIDNNLAAFVLDESRADIRFVHSVLLSKKLSALVATTALPALNGKQFGGMPLAVPPLAEQRAIATALSDIEALLAGLDRLIAKKRDLKQAAIQQLLTGQTRLPGFQGKWEISSLNGLGTWRGGMTPSMSKRAYWEGGAVPWISSGDVKVHRLTDTSQHVTSLAVREGAAVIVPAGAVVVVTRSGILRRHLPVAMVERPMAINQDIKALVPDKSVASEFALHALHGYGNKILASCLKTGTTVESVEFPWLMAFPISVPPRKEQEAIATALSDMDAELTALEARRDKTRALKQGMMQELLTGRTRLV